MLAYRTMRFFLALPPLARFAAIACGKLELTTALIAYPPETLIQNMPVSDLTNPFPAVTMGK